MWEGAVSQKKKKLESCPLRNKQTSSMSFSDTFKTSPLSQLLNKRRKGSLHYTKMAQPKSLVIFENHLAPRLSFSFHPPQGCLPIAPLSAPSRLSLVKLADFCSRDPPCTESWVVPRERKLGSLVQWKEHQFWNQTDQGQNPNSGISLVM